MQKSLGGSGVRPWESRDDHFEDLPNSINASKGGIYFPSRLKSYYPGRRDFVAFPYPSPHDPMTVSTSLQVVRVERLENGKSGRSRASRNEYELERRKDSRAQLVVVEDTCPS